MKVKKMTNAIIPLERKTYERRLELSKIKKRRPKTIQQTKLRKPQHLKKYNFQLKEKNTPTSAPMKWQILFPVRIGFPFLIAIISIALTIFIPKAFPSWTVTSKTSVVIK